MNIVESKTPIVILNYHNCELFCCHLDGYKTNTNALIHRLELIEMEFLSRPTQRNLKVWYNMDENTLDKTTMILIVQSICRIQRQIRCISFIGLNEITRWKFNALLERSLGKNMLSKTYYLDAESAKRWLIS